MENPALTEDWHATQAARINLLLTGIPRVNVMLIGMDGVIERVLATLRPDLHEPIATWRGGERLVLPPVEWRGTMILHDVGRLAHEDQRRLLKWLECIEGRTQVVSTTPESLLQRVETGRFIDSLYYRLNTICVDGTSVKEASGTTGRNVQPRAGNNRKSRS